MYTEQTEPEVIFTRNYVPGLAEVAMGFKPLYPTTIYNISGDDTSGIAGLLYPDGTFTPTRPKKSTQKFWEFEETDEYILNENIDGTRKVVGYSWREGEVVWDGSSVGGLDLLGLDGDESDAERNPVTRRVFDASLAEDLRETTGELWRAVRRGTGMR